MMNVRIFLNQFKCQSTSDLAPAGSLHSQYCRSPKSPFPYSTEFLRSSCHRNSKGCVRPLKTIDNVRGRPTRLKRDLADPSHSTSKNYSERRMNFLVYDRRTGVERIEVI